MAGQTKTYPAQLVRVIDGDTVVVEVDLGLGVSVERHVRIETINCPEMDAHIPGYRARNACVAWWADLGNQATLHTRDKTDHYGRLLGDFTDPLGRTLSDHLKKHDCTQR